MQTAVYALLVAAGVFLAGYNTGYLLACRMAKRVVQGEDKKGGNWRA